MVSVAVSQLLHFCSYRCNLLPISVTYITNVYITSCLKQPDYVDIFKSKNNLVFPQTSEAVSLSLYDSCHRRTFTPSCYASPVKLSAIAHQRLSLSR